MQYSAINSLYFIILGGALLVSCAGWDDEVAFPESYKETYTSIHECKPSVHQKANSITTWINPIGMPTWEAMSAQPVGDANPEGGAEMTGGTPSMMDAGSEAADDPADFPVGTVLVKVQYTDAACSNLSGYTVMEKLSPSAAPELGDWKWQFVNDDGSCSNCDAGISCAGCHSGCTSGPTHVCTTP